MGRLDGKVALITGGARGMGAAHVRAFVAEGARVVIGDVLVEEGRALEQDLGESCRFLTHDVTSEADWDAAIRLAQDAFGGLDVLVNNAGVMRFGGLDEMSIDGFRQIFDINLLGQWIGMKKAAAVMQSGASIVNISSINGLVGGTRLTAYTAAKFGVTGLTQSAALELGPRGIRVNSVHPGAIATPMNGLDGSDLSAEGTPVAATPIRRWAHPSEVSGAVVFLASDDSSYCMGTQILVDGGMLAGPGF